MDDISVISQDFVRAVADNISTYHLNRPVELARIVSACRVESDKAASTEEKSFWREVAQGVCLRVNKSDNEFTQLWGKKVGVKTADFDVLRYYSRKSDMKAHTAMCRCMLGFDQKTHFTDTELRDYYISMYNDELIKVSGHADVYYWTGKEWTDENVLSRVRYKLSCLLNELYTWRIQQLVTKEDWDDTAQLKDLRSAKSELNKAMTASQRQGMLKSICESIMCVCIARLAGGARKRGTS